MSKAATGWAFVVAQFLLLLAFVIIPTGQAWPVPSWLGLLVIVLIGLGAVVVIVSMVNLGAALTPTPVPNGRSHLRTEGVYKYVRHPIYSGVMLIVIGLSVGNRQWIGVLLGVATILFFNLKARWEEQQLSYAFPDYSTYARQTPRFIPQLSRLDRSI